MKKFIKWSLITISLFTVLVLTAYLYVIPNLISNNNFLEFIKSAAKNNLNAELSITNPVLKTSLKPEITFSVDNLSLKKNGELLLNLQNIDSKINFYKFFARKITLEKLGADDIYIDINELQNLKIKKEKEKKKKKAFFKVECFNTLFYIKQATVLYVSEKGVKAKLLARNLEISDGREPKFLHFGIFLDLVHKNEHLKLFFLDKNKVYFKDRKLHADDFKFYVEKSKITVNFLLDEKNNYDLTVSSDKFAIDNVRRFLNTDLLIPNGHEYVSCFKDFKGDFNFKINLNNKGLNGFLKVNQIGAKLIPLADLPLSINKGLITLNSNDIEIKDFDGFYGMNKKNKISLEGSVKDYSKTAETDISLKGIIYDEFAKYLSKLAGMKINVKNSATTNFNISLANNTKLDIKGNVKVPKGSDVLFENSSISPTNYLREFDIDMDLFKETLSINNIDYHILNNEKTKAQKPLITVKGKINVLTGVLNEMGFDIPEPLPSEFFNVLAGQRLFRSGTFSGKMDYVNSNNPHLDGYMALKDTFIVGQGIFIKNLNLKTYNNIVKLISDGYIRRAKYDFNADILNRMVFPIIVQNTNFSFDEIDVEKVMQTFAPRPQIKPGQQPLNRLKIQIAKSNISRDLFEVQEQQKLDTQTNDVQIAFQPNILEIKKCMLNVKKGAYKKMTFGNLHANLTLSREGILEIKSNRFDLTEGFSSLKVYCDLFKQKYSIKLGAKDVDTDAIASSVLNLNKEITGKAKSLMEFYTDESLKLNGKIQFEVNDGSIAKLGFVQYVLNMASVFRNPLVMINPASLADIVNIPEGTFKKINGTLIIKNNSVDGFMVKSSSPQLSAFIVGRLNLENMDASLRIYTKFSNDKSGVFGFLRGISLNSLAKKASAYTKADTESYYAAELSMLPKLDIGEETAQVFLTKFDGDIQSNNFISSLQKIK